MRLTKEEIRTLLSLPLPGAKAHRKMLPKERLLEVPESLSHKTMQSSVLLLLYNHSDELSACLIKRPSHMKHHAGQIALPGGKVDGDETLTETALRETYEEIGIPDSEIEILGSLSELYIQVSNFLVHPVVGWLDRFPELTINPEEVEKVIPFPLSCYSKGLCMQDMDTLTGRLDVPVIRYDGEIIWGATAMILAEFMAIIQQTEN